MVSFSGCPGYTFSNLPGTYDRFASGNNIDVIRGVAGTIGERLFDVEDSNLASYVSRGGDFRWP
jgi:hypothetical protein